MKKLFLISATAVTLLAVVFSATISANKTETDIGTSVTSSTDSREILYIMKAHKGEIGVFKPDESEPLYTLESVHIKSLPQYDQSLLNTGIKIYSERELQSLIEDYDS